MRNNSAFAIFRLAALICAAGLLSAVIAPAQIPAFPGAVGFGAYATGGRGGTVYHVTTLADSGPGSFRDAVSHSGRIVVFDVGGYIHLNSAVSVQGNITIAGQTAPGGGIGFYGGEISFASRSNIICRYIRIRPGSLTASTSDDALSLYRARDVILDHCSFEFGPWNNVDAVSDDWQNWPVTDITFQNCLDANPIYQQFGAHTESVSSRMTWFGCIFANSHNRNPLAKINTVFLNNVLYNCSAGYTTHTSTSFSHDIVNNYFISGPATGGSTDFPWYQIDNNQSIYAAGNLFDTNADGALNGVPTSVYWYQGGGTVLSAPWSSVTTSTPIFPAATAFRVAVSRAGALPRDAMDNLILSQVKTLGNAPTGTGMGTAGPDGSLYTSQTQTGLSNNGYGAIAGGVPPADSDGDGLPDYWEKAVGLNPLNASDATALAPDGYMNIEHYLNWLADPHALTTTNSAVDVDLWQFTSGFTNANPIYAAGNASNGVVTLTGGHIAHFTPAANFAGLAGFQFSVVTTDAAYTNTVSVLVTPQSLSAGGANLTWVGDGVSNVWAAGGATNFFDGTNLVAFQNGDTVTFDDTGAATPPIQLSGTLAPAAVYVAADTQDYTFAGSGAIVGTGTLFKVGAGNLLILTTNTFNGGVTIDEGVVQLGDGVSANGSLAGNITNNDTLIYDNPGPLTNAVNLSGSGVLVKNGAGALILSGTQTYTNTTTLNAGALQFSGVIPPSDVTDNGNLIFAPSGFTIYRNVIRGSGSLATSPSGVLLLSGANSFAGNLTNTGGFLILSNNAAAGAGDVVYLGGFVVPAAGMVITNRFVIPGNAASDLCLMATNSGTAVWAGDVIAGSSGGQWRPGSDGGTLVFTGNAALGSRYLIVPRGAVQFASNAVVSTTQTGCAFGRDLSGNNRSASITIRDNARVTLGACNLGGGQAGGNVTVTIQDNAVLDCGTNLDLNNVNRATAQTFLRLNGGTLVTGGFTKTKTGQTNSIAFNGGVLKAAANNAAFLPNFTAATSLVQAGGAVIDDGGFAITLAAPLIHDPALGTAPDGGLTKRGGGTLRLTADARYTGPTVVLAGRIVAGDAKTFSSTSGIDVEGGAQLDVSGAAGFTLASGQTLSGNGAVNGDFTVGPGANLSPGSNGIGMLTFSNSLALAAGATNFFEIRAGPPTNDSVKVFGTLANGGVLVVTNAGGAPAAGNRFKLFDATSYSGNFSSVILPPLGAGLAWDESALNTAGVISVVATVPPAFDSISVSGRNVILSGGGPPGGNFYLLGSTNLATPLTNWTRLWTNQFDAAGRFNFTNLLEAGGGNFYLLETP